MTLNDQNAFAITSNRKVILLGVQRLAHVFSTKTYLLSLPQMDSQWTDNICLIAYFMSLTHQ